MKLKDYYKEVRDNELDQSDKLYIYNNFIDKIEKVSLYKRFSFYWKISVYTFFILFFLLSFYFPYYLSNKAINELEENYDISKVWTWVISKEKTSNNSISNLYISVKAEYIWKIIETKWEFKIINSWNEVGGYNINNWDTILLSNKSEMTFTVNSWVTANIEWPAELNIELISEEWKEKKYVINLIHWKFFEIESITKSEDNVLVKTDDIEIETKIVWDKLDFNISSEWEKHIVENKWWEIVVKKVVKKEKKFASLKTNQKAEIDEDIRMLQEVKKIKEEIKNKDIEVEYVYSENKETEKSIETWSIEVNTLSGSLLDNEENIDNTISTVSDIEYTSKSILSEEKMSVFKKLIYPSFLMKEIEWISTSYLNWSKSWFEISYNQLHKRLWDIYDIFWISIWESGEMNIENLYISLDWIISEIENNYFMPDIYIKRLKALKWRLLILKNNEFWQFSSNNIAFDKIFVRLWISDYKENLLVK